MTYEVGHYYRWEGHVILVTSKDDHICYIRYVQTSEKYHVGLPYSTLKFHRNNSEELGVLTELEKMLYGL